MFGSLRNNSNEHSNKSRRDDDNTMDNEQNNKLLSKLNRWFYRGITCHVLSKNHAQTVILEEMNHFYCTENQIGKKHLRRRRRINEEVRSNQRFTKSDDDAIEVQQQRQAISIGNNWSQQTRTNANN